MRARGYLLLMALVLLLPGLAWADGTQYTGTCSTLSWNANTEPDLAGYRLYDRVSLTATPTRIATYGPQITSVKCASLGFNPGQHYISITAIDTSGNESAATAEIPFVLISNAVTNLRVTVVNATDMTLAFTEVDGGTGSPATYDIRVATPTINWGTAASVASGTCSTPVAGTTIGATKTCTVTGLALTTPYQFQLVPYRGTPGVDAVYAPLSNIAGATTGGSVPAVTERATLVTDTFDGADRILAGFWQGGYNNSGGAPTTDLQVVSTRLRATNTTTDAVMTHTVDLPGDQWCQMTITTIAGAGHVAPRCLLRFGLPGAANGYEFTALRGGLGRTSRIGRWINGQFVELVSENATTWATSDVLRGEILANVLSLYRNNALLLQVTDSTYTSGRGGLILFVNSALTDSEIDDVSFGGFAVAGSSEICGCDNH